MAHQGGFENHRLRTLIWIVRQLRRQPLSLHEINLRWKANVDLSAGEEIERRTFCNYLHAIYDLFHIEIECRRSDGFRYHITRDERSSHNEHIMANFEMAVAVERGRGLGDTLLLEEIPAGHEYLETIVQAIDHRRKLEFTFQDFNIEGPFTLTGDPYALKCYQQRWYLVLRDDETDLIDTFSLDRIVELHMLDVRFTRDPAFDAKEYFRYAFGVRVCPDEQPDLIRLRVASVQCGYFRTLKLHHSQLEVETHADYSIFTIKCVVTVELIIKLLSYGSLVEVLSPESLREEIKEEVARMHKTYHGRSKH